MSKTDVLRLAEYLGLIELSLCTHADALRTSVHVDALSGVLETIQATAANLMIL